MKINRALSLFNRIPPGNAYEPQKDLSHRSGLYRSDGGFLGKQGPDTGKRCRRRIVPLGPIFRLILPSCRATRKSRVKGGFTVKQNITISLDKELIQEGKVIAAKRGTSLNRMLRLELEKIIRNARQYDIAKQKAIAAMKAGFHSGMDRYPSRDELHER